MASGILDRIIDIFVRVGAPAGASIAADLVTIDAFFDVPAADAVTNTTVRDVVGNKSDVAQTTVGTTRSTIAYVKGILNRLGAPVAADLSADIQVIDTNVDTLVTRVGVPVTSVSADLAVVDGFMDVPAADAVTNAQVRDVVGNKSDAAQTTVGTSRSIIAYVKGLLNRVGTPAGASVSADIATVNTTVGTINTNVSTIQTRLGDPADATLGAGTINQKINTIDAFFDVPIADSTADTTVRDVVGRKTDTASQDIALNNVSVVRLLKGVLESLNAPASADNVTSATTSFVAELLGRKDDTASTTVNTTSTLTRYIKGLVGETIHATYGLSALNTKLDTIRETADAGYNRETDSLEAIRDAVDALGATAPIVTWNYNIPSVLNLSDADIALEIYAQDARGNLITTAEITPGTCAIDEWNPGTSTWVSRLAATANSEASGIVRQTENFNGAAGYTVGRTVRITFTGIQVIISGNTVELPTQRFYVRLNTEGSAAAWGSNGSGSVLTDGTEQNILLTAGTGAFSDDFLLYLDVDMNPMVGGATPDTVVIRVYKEVDGTNSRLSAVYPLSGVQETPIKTIANGMWGDNTEDIRISIQRTGGTDRTYNWRYGVKTA